ncbi:hypothetical protein [Adlercreutzia sp. ZJ242]|uniref:hypothetical protein n=1 Tax=Adlercreutzia sp. ZJ242 TaxID=2709409 RepID=UPI0013EA0C7C|nr:hypothetical protein [Adlercreutzia sp. ZJ242]
MHFAIGTLEEARAVYLDGLYDLLRHALVGGHARNNVVEASSSLSKLKEERRLTHAALTEEERAASLGANRLVKPVEKLRYHPVTADDLLGPAAKGRMKQWALRHGAFIILYHRLSSFIFVIFLYHSQVHYSEKQPRAKGSRSCAALNGWLHVEFEGHL